MAPMSDSFLSKLMSAAKPSTAPPANKTATDTPPAREMSPIMDAEATTAAPTATVVEDEATAHPPRLLDSDPNKFRSLKQVIVIGRPGTGTDGISDALKKLGFKVYDFQAASDRYERDFPLWVEAARLRSEGRPYTQSDYDKVIGDYNAIVGAPTCFFDTEFVKLYPSVKVILVTREHDAAILASLLRKASSRFWRFIDPGYYGNVFRFLLHNIDSGECDCTGMNERVVREFVRGKNLLVIHNLVAWVPLCQFLGVKVPDGPAPELHDNTIKAESAARPQRLFSERVNRARRRIVLALVYTSKVVLLTLVAALAVVLGAFVLAKLLFVSYKLFHFLVVRSQIRDVTRLLAAGVALASLVCGFIAGYSFATLNASEAMTVVSPCREYQHKSRNGWKKGKQDRGRQLDHSKNTRPERPTLPSWSGVQDDIRKNDVEILKEAKKEGKATSEEWRNGKHVTFNVTHKLTESGQHVFSGPRKVLSVTEERIE